MGRDDQAGTGPRDPGHVPEGFRPTGTSSPPPTWRGPDATPCRQPIRNRPTRLFRPARQCRMREIRMGGEGVGTTHPPRSPTSPHPPTLSTSPIGSTKRAPAYLGPVRPRHPPGHRGIEIVVAGWQSADGPRPGDDFPTVDNIHRIFLRPPARPRKLFPRPLDQGIY